MVCLNKVFVAGRLAKNPTKKVTSTGLAVTSLFVAIKREFFSRTGEHEKEECFVDVVVFGQQAEDCWSYLKESSQILIEGRLQMEPTSTIASGQTKALQIAAEKIQFFDHHHCHLNETEEPKDG